MHRISINRWTKLPKFVNKLNWSRLLCKPLAQAYDALLTYFYFYIVTHQSLSASRSWGYFVRCFKQWTQLCYNVLFTDMCRFSCASKKLPGFSCLQWLPWTAPSWAVWWWLEGAHPNLSVFMEKGYICRYQTMNWGKWSNAVGCVL